MSRCSASDTLSANWLLRLKSIVVTYCHIEGEDGISHRGSRIAFMRTLRPIAEGEKERCEQEVDIGILENHIVHDT